MVYADGSVFEGIFKDGEKIEGQRELAKFTTTDKYYALVIGNNKYKNKEVLEAAANDAVDAHMKEVEEVQKELRSITLENIRRYPEYASKRDDFYSLWQDHGPEAARLVLLLHIWNGEVPRPSEVIN